MLKASYEALQSSDSRSFLVRSFEETAFTAPYHYHPEYELTLITKGEGRRFVGSHMADYKEGDLLLLGSNLPHCWKTEAPQKEQKNACSIVVQFSHDFLGTDFFSKAELSYIARLLERSSNGIRFIKKTQDIIGRQMVALAAEVSEFKKLILLLEILQQLAISTDYILLEQKAVSKPSAMDLERINPVFVYLIENYRGEITLDKAAETANMTPNAFCKYFKKITRKTFMEMVIDYRLNYATQQLIQTDKTISAICYESGFGDVSHFYKIFKARMQLSPLHYRKKFMLDVHEGEGSYSS
jgi:AraC-like DNA-binding protein